MLPQQHSLAFLAKMTENKSLEQLRDLLRPSTEAFKSPLKGHKSSDVLINQRRQHANIRAEQLPLSQAAEIYQHNIENLCGEIRVPLGLAGPISVRGLHANGNYFFTARYHRSSVDCLVSSGQQTH